MKILDNYEDLVGKTIVFSHMAQFAEQITLATTDGDVLMATFDYDEERDSVQIRTLHEGHVIKRIKESRYLKEALAEVGAFDMETYQKEQAEQRKLDSEKWEKEKMEREIKQLAELKAKYPEEGVQ